MIGVHGGHPGWTIVELVVIVPAARSRTHLLVNRDRTRREISGLYAGFQLTFSLSTLYKHREIK
jgi:hypothetical protein